jgi:transcriptional regulator with XRE-family HTH domain
MKIITKVEALQKARVKLGLNVNELGRLSGIPHSTLLSIEKKQKHPSPATTKKICDALKMDFDELFEIKVGE